ncbi:hypothetical protein [Streptomyces sp. NPDC058603]|uniref:hypothetical protein n=1 Tax=Streptomyces sp. NPDC058603 TaxID=3346551 RepID=UPI0036683931
MLEYITITKNPQFDIALGSDPRAAGILQTTGHFVPAPGPRGEYHRQPHTLPVEQQRQGAAADALLPAGFSVHLDPTPNTRPARRARQCGHLGARRRKVLAEVAAPHEGLPPWMAEPGAWTAPIEEEYGT